MPIPQLVEQLKKSDIGRIYWANFCMQQHVGLLDLAISKAVFHEAANNPDYLYQLREVTRLGVGDASTFAMMSLISSAEANSVAISASKTLTTGAALPARLSTVLSVKTFTDHCLSDVGRDKLTALWTRMQTWLPGGRKLGIADDCYRALEGLPGMGMVDINKLHDHENFLVPKIKIRTRYLRFWMGGDPAAMPGNADEIRDQLALGYLKKDQDALVRISFDKTVLHDALSKASEPQYRRPSAFCVNDVDAPRFRGRSGMETIDPPSHNSHGNTVKLIGGIVPDEGVAEWICPSIEVDSTDIHVELLGPISVDHSVPSNGQFADYLQAHGCLTPADERAILDALT